MYVRAGTVRTLMKTMYEGRFQLHYADMGTVAGKASSTTPEHKECGDVRASSYFQLATQRMSNYGHLLSLYYQ